MKKSRIILLSSKQLLRLRLKKAIPLAINHTSI